MPKLISALCNKCGKNRMSVPEELAQFAVCTGCVRRFNAVDPGVLRHFLPDKIYPTRRITTGYVNGRAARLVILNLPAINAATAIIRRQDAAEERASYRVSECGGKWSLE